MKDIKIKFSDFLAAYKKSPKCFTTYVDSVIVKAPTEWYSTKFGLIDKIRYKLWKLSLSRRMEVADRAKVAEALRTIRDGDDTHG